MTKLSQSRARWILGVIFPLLTLGEALAGNQEQRSANQEGARRGLLRGSSCAQLADLDDQSIQAIVNFAASGERWYCRLEQTALCQDYEVLVHPRARLKGSPGGYLCTLRAKNS